MFSNAESISFRGKEVKQIIKINNGAILYQKTEDDKEPLEFVFTGTTLTQDTYGYFSGTDMIIDYGDGVVETTTGKFGHTYAENGTYTIKIYGVTSLEDYCFYRCTGLTSITLPNTIASLGKYCFSGCTSLTSITLPNTIASLGQYCFDSCTSLTSITLPINLTTLGKRCFGFCTNLTSINIPDSVISLGDSCFKNCTSLISMNIPDSVITLGDSCFENCSSLISITISDNVTYLGKECFYFCTGLTSINIPSNVTILRQDCFCSCSNLTSINIPNTVTSIENNCFKYCTSLTSIILNWTTSNQIVAYNSNWIINANANLKFEIPEGTTNLYIEKGYPSDKLVEISSDETVDISVSVVYDNDNNNQDGNRPTEIPIELIVSGTIVIRTATLTPENNWSYTFSDLEDGISYQLSASEIDFYDLDITQNNNDFIITADYLPPLTNATVQVTFDDVIPDYRPQSITATLNNGTEVTLTNNNGWSTNISNLPAVVNHETATYDWTIAQVPHYEIFQKTKNGNVTRFILKQLDNIPASITLEKTDGKQILSYVDRYQEELPATGPHTAEFCELTATVMDKNNNPLSNICVDFYLDGILYSNSLTNSNGQAVSQYTSQGIGDVEIYAKIGNLVTETYKIEDLYRYIPCTSKPSDFNHGVLNVTYSSNGMRITSNSGCNNSILVSNILPTNFEASWIWNGSTTSNGYTNEIAFGCAHMEFIKASSEFENSEWNGTQSTTYHYSGTINIGDKFTIKRQDGVLFYYKNDILMSQHTQQYPNNHIFIWSCANRVTIVKDIKIKQL